MADEELLRRLDTLIALLRLTNSEKLAEVRNEITKDPTNSAILALTADWCPAGSLQKRIMEKSKDSARTIARRIASLVDLGILERRGGAATTAYRSTGLI